MAGFRLTHREKDPKMMHFSWVSPPDLSFSPFELSFSLVFTVENILTAISCPPMTRLAYKERVKHEILRGCYSIDTRTDWRCVMFLKRLLSPTRQSRFLDVHTISNEYVWFEAVDWDALFERKYIPPYYPPSTDRIHVPDSQDPSLQDYSTLFEDRQPWSEASYQSHIEGYHYERSRWQIIRTGSRRGD